MNKAGRLLLAAGMVLILMLSIAATLSAAIGGYQRIAEITYTGVDQDRGISVNKNPNSQYYGYLYVCDGTANSRQVRILRPDPADKYAAATSYVEVGTISSPETLTNALMSCFVGQDDKVYVANYSAKTILVGDPQGGTFTTLPFTTTERPRGLWVTGDYNTIGTKVYIAEATYAAADRCEIFEYQATGWQQVYDLDPSTQGIKAPYSVSVDNAGNSYWLSSNNGEVNVGGVLTPIDGFKYMLKVKPDYTVDDTFSLQIPDGFIKLTDGTLAYSLTPTSVCYSIDAYDLDANECLYVSMNGGGDYTHANCMLRFKTDGTYMDGFGMGWWMPSYGAGLSSLYWSATAPSYSPMEFWNAPSGNSNPWMTVDDKHNIYVMSCKEPRDTLGFPPALVKFHRTMEAVPSAPSDLTAGNDIYGQIKLAWKNNSIKGAYFSYEGGATTCNIYRSTDTNKPTEVYATVSDAYPKWKDSVQGQTAGGPFYYWVTAVNSVGESEAVGPVGPISTTVSTAPASRSKSKIAVTYSEYSDEDKLEVGDIVDYWDMMSTFLDKRNVGYDKMFDADASGLNIENDDIAGYPLLFLLCNLEMSSYEAQCIRDYVNLNGGRIVSTYWNSEYNIDCTNTGNFKLADIYGADVVGWNWDATSTRTWDQRAFRFMRPTDETDTAKLFAGIPSQGALQPGTNPMALVCQPRDGAKIIGNWSDRDGDMPYGPNGTMDNTIASNCNAAAVANYIGGEARSLWLGIMWWWRMPETPGASGTTYSATKIVENCLNFFDIPFTPVGDAGASLGDRMINVGDNHTTGLGELVVTMLVDTDTTGSGYDQYYVESKDRSAGIKIKFPSDYVSGLLNPGQLVTVSGNITSEGETLNDGTYVCGDRVLEVWEVWQTGDTLVDVKPLYMQTKNVVGPYISHQQGLYDTSGVNNLGLYIRLSGKITYVDGIAGYLNYFYIDDGSGIKDGTTHLDTDGQTVVDNVGIRVMFPQDPSQPGLTYNYYGAPDFIMVGNTVSVTGCASLGLIGQVGSTDANGQNAVGIRAIRIPVTYDLNDYIKLQSAAN